MNGKISMIATALLSVSACASVIGDTETAVQIRTKPEAASCRLAGQGGYAASLVAPATISIPHNASPVTVTCQAPGFRPTSHTLTASAGNWIWGNSALIFGTAGVMVLGAVVDESRGAGKAFAEDVEYILDPDTPRTVRVKSRGGEEMLLKAR